MSQFTALVLAGRRASEAASASGDHPALLEVCGVPSLLRVVRSLRASRSVGRLTVSTDDRDALTAVPELAELAARGELAIHASLPSPSRSVLDVLEGLAPGERLLVTTADHALLTPEIIDHFTGAGARDADVLVGVVPKSVVSARYPQSVRTYLRLRGEAFTGANLFAFATAEGRRAAAFWTRAEEFRKRPWRLVSVFGPTVLLLFALRRLDLEASFERASRAMGARLRPVSLPFAEAAIDVDRPADLALASEILQRRRSPSAEKRPEPGS